MINQTPFNKRELLSLLMLAVIGGAAANILPFIFSAFSREFELGLTSTLTTIELLGICVAGLSFRWWRNKLSLFSWCLLGMGAYIVGNGLTFALPKDVDLIMAARFVSGLGAGIVTSHAFAIIGRQKNPEPLFALVLFVQVIWSALASFIMPVLNESGNLLPFSFLFVCGIIATLPVLLWLPKATGEEAADIEDYPSSKRLSTMKTLMILTTVLWYTALGLFWADSADRGVEMGLSGAVIGIIFATGYLASLLGNGLAIWLANRYDRLMPMLISGLVHLLVYFLFYLSTDAGDIGIYSFAVLAYSLSWAVFTPFQLGLFSEFSADGRFTATFLPATVVGMTIGTQFNGFLGEDGKMIMAMSLMAVCLVAYWYVFRTLPKFYKDLEQTYGPEALKGDYSQI